MLIVILLIIIACMLIKQHNEDFITIETDNGISEKKIRTKQEIMVKYFGHRQDGMMIIGNKRHNTITFYVKSPKVSVQYYIKTLFELFGLNTFDKYSMELFVLGNTKKKTITEFIILIKDVKLNHNFSMNLVSDHYPYPMKHTGDLWRYREDNEITMLEYNDLLKDYYGILRLLTGVDSDFFRHKIIRKKDIEKFDMLTDDMILKDSKFHEIVDDTNRFKEKYGEFLKFLNKPVCYNKSDSFIPLYDLYGPNTGHLGRPDMTCGKDEYLNGMILRMVPDAIHNNKQNRLMFKYRCCK